MTPADDITPDWNPLEGEQLARPPSDLDRAANTRAIHRMSRANRFRLMFGLPLFPEDPAPAEDPFKTT